MRDLEPQRALALARFACAALLGLCSASCLGPGLEPPSGNEQARSTGAGGASATAGVPTVTGTTPGGTNPATQPPTAPNTNQPPTMAPGAAPAAGAPSTAGPQDAPAGAAAAGSGAASRDEDAGME